MLDDRCRSAQSVSWRAMRRNLANLSHGEFDILVVGGGAAGAAVAREACIRGFSTALVERDDFGAGSSAHCFKVVHGGIRYLQHLDIPRMRASCLERAILLRIAPHLVSPLPFVVPTFGRAKGSRWFLGTGMLIYDLLTRDCNAHVIDPKRRIGNTRFLSCSELRALFPHIDAAGLTGAAVFEDGQMYSPPRLVLAFAAAAEALGASIANYVQVEQLLRDGQRVTGATVRDVLTGERFTVRAKLVINAAGPWAEGLLREDGKMSIARGTYSRDACFVLARNTGSRHALAVQGRTRDTDAILARPARHMFLVPWRTSTLVGVWHKVVTRDPDATELTGDELREYVREINDCYPALNVQESEITMTGFGLVPFGAPSQQRGDALSFGKQSRIIDHRLSGGIEGLISLISVRYTVARKDAAQALDEAEKQLGRRRAATESSSQPLYGGVIHDYAAFLKELKARWPAWLPPSSCDSLAQNYGSGIDALLNRGDREPSLRRCLPGSNVSHAEVVHAVREEMAECMTDVVFRRTELGTDAKPNTAALDEVQELMQRECGWSQTRAAKERAAVERHLQRYHAALRPAQASISDTGSDTLR
jgi:glycerol-3-phosphate dehydrogenase